MSRGDDGFLARWERRKADVAREEEASRAPAPDPEPAKEETRSDEEILAELGLKHPDALEAGDDFKVFLQSAVPAHLRKLALRRLWQSNPVLANLDGLNDYDDDFRTAAHAGDAVQTAYQVGKGIVRQIAEVLDDDGAPAAEPEPEGDEVAVEAEVPADTDPDPEPTQTMAELAAEDRPQPAAGRRRMRFRIPEN